MTDRSLRLSAHSRELFLEELIQHPLACLLRRTGSSKDGPNKQTDGSVASGLTMDSTSSLDFCDLEHPDLPVMVGSSVSEMLASSSASFYNNSSSSGLPAGVQADLKFGCDRKLAQKYCFSDEDVRCHSGEEEEDDFCFEIQSTLEEDAEKEVEQKGRIKFYDSSSGKCLFMVPRESVHRTFDEFMKESIDQGYLSFRDYEVNWDRVRCLQNGEMFSTDGTRLGFFSPDAQGNKYLINLLAVAGRPVREKKSKARRRRSMGAVLGTSPSVAARKGRKALRKMLSQRQVYNDSEY
jgi:hypothetical protein